MASLDQIHGYMTVNRIKDPIAYPACSLAELKFMHYLSSVAIGKANLQTKNVTLNTATGYSTASILEKPGAFGELTGLVMMSENPILEGMIVSDFSCGITSRIHRPIFAHAKYTRQQQLESDEMQLEIMLNYLGLAFPDQQNTYFRTFKALLQLSNLHVGASFDSNINIFSRWITQTIRSKNLQSWSINR